VLRLSLEMAAKEHTSRIVADIRYLWRHAAAIGIVLAVLCHLVPPQYRALCDQVKSICSLGKD